MPDQVAVDSRGVVFVADTFNHRVCTFGADGAPLQAFKGSGDDMLRYPLAIACAVGRGEVFVSDWGNDRVMVFSNNGTPLRAIGGPGMEEQDLSGPAGLAIDFRGSLVVGDYSHHRLQVFVAQDGEHEAAKTDLQLPDGSKVQLGHAAGVAASRDGAVAISDDANHAIIIF
ncbi:hypothetical protein T484DRAFT_1763706 [Baffinella frigidus]|nr:hypothetical protein T484DRAFT_1763706 [Cryptophyta sp. CCMP2293]